ncbi:carbohydrate-binding family 9-like protein [Emticicia sp. 17c]|uniref:carbohydrate-binding family 9-like protein n=1 Tax=Emticicia sp. 17c TaxID=3127704 RepID=UPI00301DBE5C
MQRLICFFTFLLFFLSTSFSSVAQEVSASGQLHILKTADFEPNGKGTSIEWEKTQWVSLPQRRNDGKVYTTNAKVLYSDTGIYFLFDCQDSLITSTLKADFTNLYLEDVVEVFLWTDETNPIYFEYELSPYNYELPILVPNMKGNFLGWLPWHYEGDRRTKHAAIIESNGKQVTGWKAEFYIPYVLLKPLNNVPPKKGTQWRANMYRLDYDKRTSAWSWQLTRTNFHDFEKFGTFIFD